MDQLLTRYHVNSDLAFFLARPMFNHQISLKCEEMRLKDPKGWKSDKERDYQGYVQAVTEVMTPVINAIRPLHSNKVWDDISPQVEFLHMKQMHDFVVNIVTLIFQNKYFSF